MNSITIYNNTHETNIVHNCSFFSMDELKKAIGLSERIGINTEYVDKRRSFLNENNVYRWPELQCIFAINRITGKVNSFTTLQDIKQVKHKGRYLFYGGSSLAFGINSTYPGDMMWCMFEDDPKDKNIVPVPEDLMDNSKKKTDFFLYPLSTDEFKLWKEKTIEFLSIFFADDNIVAIQTHMDEDVPNIQAFILSSYQAEDGSFGFSCGKVIEGCRQLSGLAPTYAGYMANFGYNRRRDY